MTHFNLQGIAQEQEPSIKKYRLTGEHEQMTDFLVVFLKDMISQLYISTHIKELVWMCLWLVLRRKIVTRKSYWDKILLLDSFVHPQFRMQCHYVLFIYCIVWNRFFKSREVFHKSHNIELQTVIIYIDFLQAELRILAWSYIFVPAKKPWQKLRLSYDL